MSTSVPDVEPGVLRGGQLRRVVAVLSVTQVVGYGVLYYAFTVLNAPILADTGWSLEATTLAFSLGQVVAGLVGIPVGRVIDKHGPRVVMTAGSLLAVPAVGLIAMAPNQLWFIAAWILAGVAMSAILYTPAFSAITHWGGARGLSGLTTVTLVAGFASTVFGPLSAQLDEHLGWRATYLLLAAVLALLTVPAHWFGLRAKWVPKAPEADPIVSEPAQGRRAFVVLAIAMSLGALAEYGVLVQLVPLLVSRGLTTTDAATVLGVGGIGQVAGRLGYARMASRTSVVQRTVAMFVLVALTSVAFPLLPSELPLLLVVSVFAGLARGCVTLLQATAIADRWGVAGIGRLNGLLFAPLMTAAAVAPFVAAVLERPLGGPGAVFYVLAAAAALASLLMPFTMPHRPQPLDAP
jgi:MFS family permease